MPGECFGEIALLIPGIVRMASIIARSFCNAHMLPRKDFELCLEDFPEITARIRELADQRMAELKVKLARRESIAPRRHTSEASMPSHLLQNVPGAALGNEGSSLSVGYTGRFGQGGTQNSSRRLSFRSLKGFNFPRRVSFRGLQIAPNQRRFSFNDANLQSPRSRKISGCMLGAMDRTKRTSEIERHIDSRCSGCSVYAEVAARASGASCDDQESSESCRGSKRQSRLP
jgi:hypothetical protein